MDAAKMVSTLKGISFGEIRLYEGEKSFYTDLNGAMIRLVRSLPSSVQADALLRIMADSRIEVGEDFNIFRNYYVPSWSVIYHVNSAAEAHSFTAEEINMAPTAQAMAMFLHSLDDHLCDDEMETTHLLLLVRSQAWCFMREAMRGLALS